MPRSVTSPDRLFDRTWRPGHPFRPKLSRLRRAGMGLALLVLCLIIGGYWYATDSNRVRGKAQEYLSRLIGGHVTIGEATVSIFQGLQLKDVCVYSDESADEDSLLFKARSFVLRVNAAALLEGRLEADQIVAIDPYVRLIEDLDTGHWNHEHLRRPTSMPRTQGDRPLQLPQVVLRNAIVEYGQLQAGQRRTRGTMAIEGQLMPALEQDVYLFKLQSRGASQGMGPSVDGKFEMSTGNVSASLMNFRLGADLEAMLPAQVRQWWKDHDIAGRVDVPELTYSRANESYRAEIDFRGVRLTVHPYEWLGADELLRSEWMRGALSAMRAAGLDTNGFVDEFQNVIEPTPIALQQVTGKFVFTESAIDIENVTGFVESNGVKISGRIENYTNPSRVTTPKGIRVSSLDTDDIIIPASPRYINSMPQPVREIYDHLRPQGRCRFWVLLKRPEAGARPEVDGEIDILGGQFVFDKFPYPIDGATGKLIFGTDPKTGAEQLEIREIRGHGPAGSANEKARVKIVGTVSPFGADSKVAITVTGDDIVSEPALFAAFPRATQKALTLFDAPGKGQFPIFRGGFTCEVLRPLGIDTEWQVTTHIRLDEAAGQLVAFPYPMSGVTGELTVNEDSVKIGHATMKKNGATLSIDGQVSWTREKEPKKDSRDSTMASVDVPVKDRMQPPRGIDGEPDRVPPLRPELHIVATNVPIDADLLSAMPPDQREWLAKMGMSGRFDLDGNVTTAMKAASLPGRPPASDVDFDFHIKLHEASLWPTQGTFAASDLNGSLRLTPGRVVFESLSGKRGDAELAARGSVSWSGPAPEIAISADAKNLALDAALYSALPDTAKSAWDQVQPKGTLDAAITYSGTVQKAPTTAPASAATTAPTTAPAENTLAGASTQPSAGFQVVLTPRKLSATPKAVPYQLDDLTGTITVSPQRVVIQDVTAKHGKASVKLSATGTGSSPEPDAPLAWDFKIAGEQVLIDDELKRALPKAMSEMLKSLQLRGTIAFEFDKLLVARSSVSAAGSATTKPGATVDDPPLDVDFSMRMRASNASMDVGVPITDIKEGTARFRGSTRGGNLAELDGAIDFPQLTLAGREASDLRAALIKPADQDLLRIPKLEARIADGEMAGQFDCILADAGPSRYALALVLRNADVKQLTGESAPDLRGRLSASLAMEGAFNDAASRRGRGDVSVNGERMYRIPLILGLLQITNLALPITSPFNEATARYIVDGNRVTFESIELRAKDMLMQGSGHLDFGTKQVRLTFVTDNLTWPKLPIIGDLLQGARHELLQIHVKGTLEEPKVSAGAFGTVTTTVDEVLRGNDEGDTYRKKR